MERKLIPIQRKLMQVIMMACGVVLVLTCVAFFTYEFITYREITRDELATLGQVIADNSTAALAFDDKKDAEENLNSLKAQKHIVSACLYDTAGQIFAYYPKTLSPKDFPSVIGRDGYEFKGKFLEGFEPVIQLNTRQGTLYLKSDMKGVNDRFILYTAIAIGFIVVSFLFAYLVSRRLQRTISKPILELAGTARKVSDERDYSVRAQNRSNDEVGILTDAFNHMLSQIESKSSEIRALNAGLEEKVNLRTVELQQANIVLTQTNAFIQTIIDSSVDLIAVFNRKLEYLILNKRADDIYHRKRDDLIGKNILEVFPALKDSDMIKNLERALKGEFVHHDAYKSVVSDRYFENFFIPLKDKDGDTDRVLVIGHDITNIMQANEKMKVVNAELEKSNQELEQFAYVASHDLQEPLRKIQIFSELSEKNVQHPDILKRYLARINSSAARMSDLIKAVLNYSRLSRLNKEFSETDLNNVLANIRTDLELVIEEKKATITSSNLPVIFANELQMQQLFLNLISNSLKFSEQAPKVNITASLVELKDGRYLQLAFSDNGIGFDTQYSEQIFAIFQRLHAGNVFAGTGIGLALCKKIVENHDGTITVESEPGKGSTFYVYFPASRYVRAASATQRNAATT